MSTEPIRTSDETTRTPRDIETILKTYEAARRMEDSPLPVCYNPATRLNA